MHRLKRLKDPTSSDKTDSLKLHNQHYSYNQHPIELPVSGHECFSLTQAKEKQQAQWSSTQEAQIPQ